MKAKVWLLATVLLLAAGQSSLADIYRKVEDGQVIFSDHPFDGAEKIDLPPLNTVPAEVAPAQQPTANAAAAGADYQIQILSPVDQQTYGYDQAIALQSKVQPGLRDGDHRVWVLDGQPLPVGQHQLKGLERGQHGVQLQIFDRHQKLLTQSSVTFFIRQNSVLVHPH